MIVIDTSALVAIILGEPQGEPCSRALGREARLAMSAGTLAEALLVARRRGRGDEMHELIDGLDIEIETVTPAVAEKVADAHVLWGRGSATNALNLGDCFAYALAKDRNCPLLFVGQGFSRTDVVSAL